MTTTPITLIDIDTSLAARTMCAIYKGQWTPTAPTAIIGAILDGLGYAIVLTGDDVSHVYRYTNREQLKRLKQWPDGIDKVLAANGYTPPTPPAPRPLLGRAS